MGGGTAASSALSERAGPSCCFSLVGPKCPATRGKLWAVALYFRGVGQPELITRIIAEVLTRVLVSSRPTA